MAKYEVVTDGGKYVVETDDGAPAPQSAASSAVKTAVAGPTNTAIDVMNGVAKLPGMAKDALEGVGSGVLSTVIHGGDMIRRATGMERVIDKPEVQRLMQPPDSAAGKTGKYAEQAAEFLIPGEAVAGAAKMLTKAPAMARIAGRAGLEAASAAGVTGAQTGGDTKAMAESAALAGGLSGAAGVIAEKAPAIAKAIKQKSVEQYQRALNPTKERFKNMAAKTVPEMIDRGIVAGSIKGLTERAKQHASLVGAAIDDAWDGMKQAGVTAKIEPILQRIEKASNEAFFVDSTKGRKVLLGEDAKRGAAMMDDIKSALADAAENNPITGDIEIPTNTLREFRQYWDTIANKAGAFTKNPGELTDWAKGEAYKKAADAVRAELAQAAPDLAKLNKEYSFWQRVADIGEQTVQRRVGQKQSIKKLFEAAGAAGGAAVGGASGGPSGAVGGAVLGKKALGTLQGIVDSTAWNTLSPVIKSRFADVLVKGNRMQSESFVRKLASAVAMPQLQPPDRHGASTQTPAEVSQ